MKVSFKNFLGEISDEIWWNLIKKRLIKRLKISSSGKFPYLQVIFALWELWSSNAALNFIILTIFVLFNAFYDLNRFLPDFILTTYHVKLKLCLKKRNPISRRRSIDTLQNNVCVFHCNNMSRWRKFDLWIVFYAPFVHWQGSGFFNLSFWHSHLLLLSWWKVHFQNKSDKKAELNLIFSLFSIFLCVCFSDIEWW